MSTPSNALAVTDAAPPSPPKTTTASPSSTPVPKRPVSGLIAILKPSGWTSMSVLEKLKPLLANSKLFQVAATDEQLRKNAWKSNRKKRMRVAASDYMAPKLGQGGTLDPLADGVLVLGIGAGTKQLPKFLSCAKEYRAVALLGTSTLSYDADEPILHRRPYDHVNQDVIQSLLPGFRGKFKQLPPLYSAIRIDGKRLFDYAREGCDLPRPVEKRDVEISDLQLVDWKEAGEHSYKEPERECDDTERRIAIRARKLAGLEEGEEREENAAGTSRDGAKGETSSTDPSPAGPPTFTLQMAVSGGTYVRSVVHDVGERARSAAHVVRLSRTRQGDWISPEYQLKEGEEEGTLCKAIPWEVLARAADELASGGKRAKTEDGKENERQEGAEEEAGDKLSEWEQLVLDHMQIIAT